MDRNLFVVSDLRWMRQDGSNAKRLAQGLCPLGRAVGHLSDGCNLLVKFRRQNGELAIDESARLNVFGGMFYVRSELLCSFVGSVVAPARYMAFFFEGTPTDARCIVSAWGDAFFDTIVTEDPAIRLASFDIPPIASTIVDSDGLVSKLYHAASLRDPEAFAVYASRFLDAPHILTALLSHVFMIQADDNIRFPVQVKKLAEQFRVLLSNPSAGVSIKAVRKSHLDLWSEVQALRFGFLDGGVARIPAAAGLEPMGLRVGIYSVRPGVEQPDDREQWRMKPYVLGDLLDRARPTRERPDMRRFHEAARYTLEPLTGLRHLREFPDTRLLLLHGPLVTQFLQYDEGEPNYLPFLSPAFLSEAGITESEVLASITALPNDPTGNPMWNQFMAIYGFVAKKVDECKTPIVGVVERPVGRPITLSVLERLKETNVINSAYVNRVRDELERYDITDDFLFGCVLQAGEYITPVQIQKNSPHRARDRWKPVVRQYPQPSALLLKTEDMNFPFRVEMNRVAAENVDFVARFLYHTARLLPRYAFPVGLDIVDKYAKVPDWISRGVSAQLTAAVLRRALKTGDAQLVTQIRLFLTSGPRDFFYRPSSNV